MSRGLDEIDRLYEVVANRLFLAKRIAEETPAWTQGDEEIVYYFRSALDGIRDEILKRNKENVK